MEKVKRPKKLSREENNIMTQKNLQENITQQLSNIYDKLDEVVEYINKKGG